MPARRMVTEAVSCTAGCPAAGPCTCRLLSSPSPLCLPLQMAETLMEKLPDVFSQYFLKNGVVHAVDQLAAVQPPAAPAEAKPEAASGDKGRGRRSSAAGRPASRAADKDGGSEGGDVRTPAGDTLRAAVGARARRFNARYFTDASGQTVGERAGLSQLLQALAEDACRGCAHLMSSGLLWSCLVRCSATGNPPAPSHLSSSPCAPCPAGCETEGARLLRSICGRLPDPGAIPALLAALAGTGNASVSTFELLSSGCVRALKGYLQVGRGRGRPGRCGLRWVGMRWGPAVPLRHLQRLLVLHRLLVHLPCSPCAWRRALTLLQGADLPADAPDRQQRLLERLGEFAGGLQGPFDALCCHPSWRLCILFTCCCCCCCCWCTRLHAAAQPRGRGDEH